MGVISQEGDGGTTSLLKGKRRTESQTSAFKTGYKVDYKVDYKIIILYFIQIRHTDDFPSTVPHRLETLILTVVTLVVVGKVVLVSVTISTSLIL